MGTLIRAIESNLTSCELSHAALSRGDLERLSTALSRAHWLRELALRNCEPESVELLFKTLSSASQALTNLVLDGIALAGGKASGEEGKLAEKLCALSNLFVSGLHDLRSLTLLDAGLAGDAAGVALGRVVAGCPHLTRLDVSCNALGSDGCAAVARSLERKHSLLVLNLTNCAIGPPGARALARALRSNRGLTELHLGWNSIASTGVGFIAEALKTNATLQVLDLRWNHVDAGAVRALSASLGSGRSSALRVVRVGNTAGSEAAARVRDVSAKLASDDAPPPQTSHSHVSFSSRSSLYGGLGSGQSSSRLSSRGCGGGTGTTPRAMLGRPDQDATAVGGCKAGVVWPATAESNGVLPLHIPLAHDSKEVLALKTKVAAQSLAVTQLRARLADADRAQKVHTAVVRERDALCTKIDKLRSERQTAEVKWSHELEARDKDVKSFAREATRTRERTDALEAQLIHVQQKARRVASAESKAEDLHKQLSELRRRERKRVSEARRATRDLTQQLAARGAELERLRRHTKSLQDDLLDSEGRRRRLRKKVLAMDKRVRRLSESHELLEALHARRGNGAADRKAGNDRPSGAARKTGRRGSGGAAPSVASARAAVRMQEELRRVKAELVEAQFRNGKLEQLLSEAQSKKKHLARRAKYLQAVMSSGGSTPVSTPPRSRNKSHLSSRSRLRRGSKLKRHAAASESKEANVVRCSQSKIIAVRK